MRKIILLVALVATSIGLAGCNEELYAEQEKLIAAQLPRGCEVHDLGPYHNIYHLIVVRCKGKDTESVNYAESSGKTTVPRATVTIED